MSAELPATEHSNPRSAGLDVLSTPALIELLIEEQAAAAGVVLSRAQQIASAVDAIAHRLRSGGCLHYVGAGSSGRLGALDAAEMPPTFGTAADMVQAHVAGGPAALVRAVEGAEDDGEAGDAAMRERVRAGDAVVGISASGGAPFVVRALERARAIGALTVALVNVEGSRVEAVAERAVVLPTGPEALTGSTRMKAGTAQKIALNAISTGVMVRLGKVYDNLMVDVVATNRKLRARALRLVRALTGADEVRASELLEAASGRVKVAVVMERRGLNAEAARELLDRHSGALRALL